MAPDSSRFIEEQEDAWVRACRDRHAGARSVRSGQLGQTRRELLGQPARLLHHLHDN
jgi:hypothetical protein